MIIRNREIIIPPEPKPNPDCRECWDSGKRERPATADHILTDTKPWEYCSCKAGRALRMK